MLARLLTGTALALATMSSVAGATELKLFHSWSNESEIGALNVIVKEFERRGNKITEMSVPHEQAGVEPAGQPRHRGHAAERLHQLAAGLLSRPFQARPWPGA